MHDDVLALVKPLLSKLALVAPAACRKHLVGRCQCIVALLRGSCYHSMHCRGLLASQL